MHSFYSRKGAANFDQIWALCNPLKPGLSCLDAAQVRPRAVICATSVYLRHMRPRMRRSVQKASSKNSFPGRKINFFRKFLIPCVHWVLRSRSSLLQVLFERSLISNTCLYFDTTQGHHCGIERISTILVILITYSEGGLHQKLAQKIRCWNAGLDYMDPLMSLFIFRYNSIHNRLVHDNAWVFGFKDFCPKSTNLDPDEYGNETLNSYFANNEIQRSYHFLCQSCMRGWNDPLHSPDTNHWHLLDQKGAFSINCNRTWVPFFQFGHLLQFLYLKHFKQLFQFQFFTWKTSKNQKG